MKGAAVFSPRAGSQYIAFFKPFAVLSQFTKEPGSEKRTLADFAFPKNVYPVGRLDYDSEGLLLLSDDGRLTGHLLEPKNAHQRTYYVQVERVPDEEALTKLRRGVLLDGRKTLPAQARLLDAEPDLPERDVPIRYRKTVPTAWVELILSEGKNRQARRMTASVGFPTLRLVRFAIGDLKITDLGLSPGEWKLLEAYELALCFK